MTNDERVLALLEEAVDLLDRAADEPSSPRRQGIVGALRVQLRQPVEAARLLRRHPH